MPKDKKPPMDMAAATALVVLGLVLPIAGISWGPGQTWQYLIWLGIGLALIGFYGATHELDEDKRDE